MEEVKIGDFSQPIIPKNKVDASPTKDRLDAAEKNLDAQAESAEAALKPIKAFEEKLKEAGVTKEQAAEIVDAVLMKGFYAEDVPLTKRISVRLRTRSARDTKRIQDYLEAQRPVYDAHYQEILARMTLASTLEKLGKDTLPFPGKDAKPDDYEQAFRARAEYVENLADPVLRLLFQKLWDFDKKIFAVLSEGTIENF